MIDSNIEQQISDSLSFYKENFIDSDKIIFLMSLYKDAWNIVDNYVSQVENNMNLNTLVPFKIIPFRTINITDIAYSTSHLSTDSMYINRFSLQESDINTRIDFWKSATVDEKINFLNETSRYITLVANKDGFNRAGNVLSFEIYNGNGDLLEEYADYIYKNNNVYLISDESMISNKIILKNLTIDFNEIEDIIGNRISLPYNAYFSKTDYAKLCNAYAKCLLGGPSIHNIENIISIAFENLNIVVTDRFSKNGQNILPFDFKINLNMSDDSRDVNVIANLLNSLLMKIKPPETSFEIRTSTLITDSWDKRNLVRQEVVYELLRSITNDNTVLYIHCSESKFVEKFRYLSKEEFESLAERQFGFTVRINVTRRDGLDGYASFDDIETSTINAVERDSKKISGQDSLVETLRRV